MHLYQLYIECLDDRLKPILIAGIVVLLSIIYYWFKNRGVLPGPKGLPYLGLYPFLTEDNVSNIFEEYKKKYGDMYSFTYSGRLYINLCSIKAMREIQLQKSDCFVDRFTGGNMLGYINYDGIFMINGESWKTIRKFFIQKFKEYGLNAVRDDMAGPVYDSLKSAIEELKMLHKKPVNMVDFLSKHAATTMRKILFGEKGVTDEEMSRIITSFSRTFEGTDSLTLLLNGPLSKFLFCVKPSYRKNMKHAKIARRTILDCAKRIESRMQDDHTTCIVEEFYKEKNKRRRNNDPSWKYFKDEVLVDSYLQFVGDGIASVASFIGSIFNILLKYPEEEERLYSEIMEVIGPNREPSAEDRPNMPYTNAFLNEYTRTSKFLTVLPSLECTKETTVRGYKIPKGSITVLNFLLAHHDEGTFEEPYTFKPSRYLHSEGKPKIESPVLFGMGKRICTGEPFVMLQSFLFLTTIVKHFKIVSSNAGKDNSFDFFSGAKLELTFAPRKES